MNDKQFDLDAIHKMDLALWELTLCLSDVVPPQQILDLIRQVSEFYGAEPGYLACYQAVNRATTVNTH